MNETNAASPALNDVISAAEDKLPALEADVEMRRRSLSEVKGRLVDNAAYSMKVAEARSRAANLYKKASENFEKLSKMEKKMNEYDDSLLSLFTKIEKLREKLEVMTSKEGGIMALESFHQKCTV